MYHFKPKTAGRIFQQVIASMGSMVDLTPKAVSTGKSRSVSESLRGDWERLGGDMTRAMVKVRDDARSRKQR